MATGNDNGKPLTSLRVLDVSAGDSQAVTRLLADLGADVLKVEPPGGDPARTEDPRLAGVSIAFALHNANKRSVVLDPSEHDDRRRFVELAASADIVVDSGRPGQAVAYGTSCEDLADRYPRLVSLAISEFGASGPRSSWRATDPVFYALSGSLSRSGPTTGTPVLPPDGIASATAAIQAVWVALVAYYNRIRCGAGEYIDFSRFDAVVTALDPVFGAQGQAAAARHKPGQWRSRPKNQDAYPIYPCRDGYVRICVMAPRQWHGLRAWLGEPAEFQGPEFDLIATRLAAWERIGPLVGELFAGQAMAELVETGQAYGVPIAAVLPPARALGSAHFAESGALTRTELAPGKSVDVPVGYFIVDGQRIGFATPAPDVGSAAPGWRTGRIADPEPTGACGARPLEGVRIVDLGVIVAGGETSRLFGDLGAEVIKVESVDYPYGLRQARVGEAISESFAWTHRNTLGLGLDLRSAEGKRIFGRLVENADAVLANFKPGTLAALGFSYDKLTSFNPAIVLAESSAFGEMGPWRAHMGYGPLVRAVTGVTRLWASSAVDCAGTGQSRHPFYDATTIFPDHVVGRITAIGALAALIGRDRTGRGSRVHVSHAEAVINQLDTRYVAETAPGAAFDGEAGAAGVHAVCPCAGDDEWCVISIRSDADWHCVTDVLGHPELAEDVRFVTGRARLANDAELVGILSTWTRARTPLHVARTLQAATVPAGQMNRPPDLCEDPQLLHRKVFHDMTHPLIDHVLPAETGPAPFRRIPQAPQRPAPLPGQDTREVCHRILGMTPHQTDELVFRGVLFMTGEQGITER